MVRISLIQGVLGQEARLGPSQNSRKSYTVHLIDFIITFRVRTYVHTGTLQQTARLNPRPMTAYSSCKAPSDGMEYLGAKQERLPSLHPQPSSKGIQNPLFLFFIILGHNHPSIC